MPEPRAITVAAFIASLTLAYTLWRLTASSRHAAAVRDWARGTGLAALGALLNVAQGDISPYFALVLGNPLMCIGAGFLVTGVRRMRGLAPRHLIWLLPALVLFVSSLWWGVFSPRLAPRVAMFSLCTFWLMGFLISALWPLRTGPLRAAAIFVLLPAGLLALAMLARATLATLGMVQDVTVAGTFNTFIYLVGAMTFVAMQTGLVLMHQLLVLEDVRTHAQRDPLTGLLNRRGLAERLPLSLRGWALVAVDVDHFKRINDTIGHAGGDAVLAFVGAVLSASLREGDLAVRMGGEEFAVLLHNRDAQQAMRIAERLRSDLERLSRQRTVCALTASLGVAIASPGDTFESLWRIADGALYAAKRQGRNQCVLAASGQPLGNKP